MTIPTKFRKSPDIAVQYDFFDIIEGTGIIRFYAGGTEDSDGFSYHLSRDVFIAQEDNPTENNITGRYYKTSTNETSFTKAIDLDFDTSTFNTTMILRGNLLCNIPVSTYTTSNYRSSETYAIVKVVIVDSDDTENQVASGQSDTKDYGRNLDGEKYFSFNIFIPESPVPSGSKLRLTVEIWHRRSYGDPGSVGVMLGHDPENAEYPPVDLEGSITEKLRMSEGHSLMQFFVPFKIEQ